MVISSGTHVTEKGAVLVCFEAPHRLLASLRDARAALGNRDACLARNLTKPHERYQRGTIDALIEALESEETVRGECTVVLAGAPKATPSHEHGTAAEAAILLAQEGTPPRAVVALLTRVFGLSRRQAYALAHRKVSHD